MPKSIKIIFIGIVLILCLIALYGFAFRPLLIKVRYTAEQIQMTKDELELIKSKVAAMPKLEATLESIQTSDKVSTSTIPQQLTISEIYTEIDSLSRASGLKIKQISTDQTFQPFVKNRHLNYIALNIEGNAYFSQVIQFLDGVSKSPFVIQVENMDLSSISKGAKPWLQFKLKLDAFEYASK